MARKRDKSKSTRSKQKPRVKAFLRQASAIIASERGLNSAAQQKLQTLAEHLKMPQDEFRDALAQLQENEKLPAGLNRYEKEFASFLRQQFQGLSSGILTVAMENKAVDLAARKYQILEARARRLIHDQAELMGVGRISKGDAETYVEQLVASRIGDATRIEDESRERFYKIGQKWGVGSERVDAIILQTLSDNRHVESPEKTSYRGWVLVTLFIVLIASGSVLTVYAKGWFEDDKGSGKSVSAGSKKEDPGGEVEVILPDWWFHRRLDELVEQLPEPFQSQLVSELTSKEPEQMIAGLSRLISKVESQAEDVRGTQRILCQYYYYCPEDSIVDQILFRLQQDLVLPVSRVPAKAERLEAVYAANRILANLKYFADDDASDDWKTRNGLVTEAIVAEFGEGSLGTNLREYLSNSNQVIAINQWNHLVQTSWSSPNRTSLLIARLWEMTQDELKSKDLNRLHRRTVLSVLESDPSLWKGLKLEITRAIGNSEPNSLNTWINHFLSLNNDDYQEWLGAQLVEKCQVTPASRSRRDIRQALNDVKFENNRIRFRELIQRNEQIRPRNRQLINAYRVTKNSPQKILEMAYTVNMNMLLAPADQSSFSFQEFDELYQRGSPDLDRLARDELNLLSNERRQAATDSDKRTLEESLKRISTGGNDKVSMRQSAIERLAKLVDRFQDITYQDAVLLARYYLSLRGDRESLNAERFLKEFVRWPSFGLAISDLIAESNVNLDQAITIVQFFAEGDYQLEDPTRWKEEVQNIVFDSVVKKTEELSQQTTVSSLEWGLLRSQFLELYQQRLTLLGDSARSNEEKQSVSRMTIRIINRLREKELVDSEYPVERAVEVLKTQSRSELEELVALNHVVIKLLAAQVQTRWPDAAAEAAIIVAEFEQTGKVSHNLAHRLLDTEFALLKLWSLEREAIASRLISQ